MNTFVAVDPAVAEGKAASLLQAVRGRLGVVPNMTRHMARSPAVLEAYLGMAGALAGGVLDAKLRERLALVTAEANGCEYCLSAHSFLGSAAGLSASDIASARTGEAAGARDQAALRFTRTLISRHGQVTDSDVAALRAAGFDDGGIGEIVAHVALNVFTNYFNKVTQPVVDFPAVKPHIAARAA